jgi:hypothetical protein
MIGIQGRSAHLRVGGAAWIGLCLSWGLILATAVQANQPPVADAGPDRYMDENILPLDGSASYDPDSGSAITSYQWTQVSGPSVYVANPTTAHPTISAFAPGSVGQPNPSVQTVVLQLVVSDGELSSEPDLLTVTMVPFAYPADTYMTLESGVFDPLKPTIAYFGGGNGLSGSGSWNNASWNAQANVFSFTYPGDPYERCGDKLLAFMSRMAPRYDRSIQTIGWSTGGQPAMLTQPARRCRWTEIMMSMSTIWPSSRNV